MSEATKSDRPFPVLSSEGLGPNVPERRECDAPICPWCERQGWDNCSHADYAKTCEVRQYDI